MIPYFDTVLITPASVVNFSLAATTLVIGAIVYFRRHSSYNAGLFFLICINVALWILSVSMADIIRSPAGAEMWARLSIIGPFFFTAFFLMLSFNFPILVKKLSLLGALLILVPSLVAISLSATQLNITNIEGGNNFIPGPLYIVLLIYIVLYLAIAVRNFYIAWKKATGASTKRQILLIVIAVASLVLIGVLTKFVTPLFLREAQVSIFGPAAATFFIFFLAQTIVKHQLIYLRVVAAEIFTFILIIVNFVEMLVVEDIERFVLRVFLFLVSAAIGLMLIRSVTTEIRRRQQLQRLAIRLDKSNQELRHLDEMKSEFISMASHQLRTPVSVIKGYLSLIKDGAFGKVKGELGEKLEEIFEMNERLVHLINNLLNISRIERGATQFWCSEINVAEIIRRVVNEMKFKIKGKDVTLTFVEPKDGVPNVFVDPERLTEVVINLIDNAIKYTHEGSITISVEGEGPDKPVIVWVEDTGVGIDAEDMKHVFQKFYRPRHPSDEHKAD